MEIKFKRYRRSRHIRITIKSAGEILVTYPWWSNRKTAEKVIEEKRNWIEKALEKCQNKKSNLLAGGSREDYLKNKKRARELINQKLKQFNQIYGLNYKKVAVRNQKTRWGSCSRNGNLNFSYRIIYLPEKLADYLIVHELCHLKEMNHSMKFWQLVGKTIPNGRKISRELKRI